MRGISLVLGAVFLAGLSVSIVRAAADTIPPSPPATLTATAVPPSQIALSWSASSDNVGVTGYYLYRNGTFYASVTGTTYTDISLGPGVYVYTVAAFDAAGNLSAQSPQASAALASDTTPPSVPTGITAVPASASTASSSATSTQVQVSWNASTDNTAVAGYNVYRNGLLLTSAIVLTATTYTDTVSPGTYDYAVAAYDRGHNVSDQSKAVRITIALDNAPPTAPANLSVVIDRALPLAMDLAWQPSADDVGVAGYSIYRNGVRVGDTSSTPASYVDKNIAPGTYLYTIAAYDAARNVSNRANGVSAVVSADIAAPSVPSNLSAARVSSGVRLSWLPSSDDVAVLGYYVYRDGAKIANVSLSPYVDSGVSLAATSTYSYTVAAYDPTLNISRESAPAIVVPSKLAPDVGAVSAPASSVPAAQAPAAAPAPIAVGKTVFTAPLYFGLRNDQVKMLQAVFSGQGYFDPANATGFFGRLTEQAVKKFQCDRNIVCSGTAASTGWGFVGVRTRAALNALAR